ncbi:MAG: ATP-binding protein [Methanobrevibacter sp.]|jgi:hypothetical protein|nr:ATP-binding protein [Candidatus Methanovirga aequatorialis]
MKDLPTGIGTFSNLIENNYLYVDKTEYIHRMAKPSKKFFLSRPRRFGKSLLVSTLEELYKGNKKLFEGLYIYDKWNWSKKFPVIHIDFGKLSYKTSDELKRSLNLFLNRTAKLNNIELDETDLITDKFAELIEEISLKNNSKVVVLIDEYDKAILDNINDLTLVEDIRYELNKFYGALKTDKFLEFVFITGISKFTKTSIFSGLNNVTDLTLHPDFVNICGYTQKDLETHFKEYLTDFSEDNDISCDDLLVLIKDWYDGYSWDGYNTVYNPYSILSLFGTGRFSNYWFETGTPTFLMNFIKNDDVDVNTLLDSNPVFSGDFPNFDLENLDFMTVLLQTGYLTIKNQDYVVGELPNYTLGIPNREVHDSLYTRILSYYTKASTNVIPSLVKKISEGIVNADENVLQESFELLIANIPYSLYKNVKEDVREANFHMMILSWLRLLGFDIQGEILTFKGRVDAILKKDNRVVVCEIKYSSDKSLDKMIDDALGQIKDTEYYKPFVDRNVLLLAVAIRDRDVKCKIEHL